MEFRKYVERLLHRNSIRFSDSETYSHGYFLLRREDIADLFSPNNLEVALEFTCFRHRRVDCLPPQTISHKKMFPPCRLANPLFCDRQIDH